MSPRFEIVHRIDPTCLVADRRTSGFLAPFVAIECVAGDGDVTLALAGPDGVRLEARYDAGDGALGLSVRDARGRVQAHRSRRYGRLEAPAGQLALTLTGRWLCAWARSGDGEAWQVRARAELPPRVDPRTPAFLAGLTVVEPVGTASHRAGHFGQLGLRDLHLVTHADGSPVEVDGALFLTATHAGPGFGDTAHTGVWRWQPGTADLTLTGRLFWHRDGLVQGDHAVHLVRDGESWLVAASTWGDFDRKRVAITLTRTEADLLTGEHVLEAGELALPTAALGRTVGVWDPHLARIEGQWHLAFTAARKFFSFRPALARATDGLGEWELLGSAEDRVATEGTTLARLNGSWHLLASDGPDNPPGLRRRYPVFDLAVREVGTLDAPYPSNIPWPTTVEHGGEQWLLTFDGTTRGGKLAGYGTHGDVLVMRGR